MKVNHKSKITLFLIITIFISFQSCYKPSEQAKAIIERWYLKKIIIPKNVTFNYIGHEKPDTNVLNHQFKVFVYIDSLGCTICRLKLSEWKVYIEKCRSLKYNISFLFIIQSSNYKELEEKLLLNNFTYPLIYDSKGEFDKLNKLPKGDKFRTFLTDRKNRVVLVGSPIHNKKISDLYDKIISGEKKDIENYSETFNINNQLNSTTDVILNTNSINLGKFSYHSIKHPLFQIKNIGKHQFSIQTVETSCGCTVAKYDKKPIKQGNTTSIILEYKPNSIGYFKKTANVICNVPNGILQLTISGEVVN